MGRTALAISGGKVQLAGSSTVQDGSGNYNSLGSAPAGNGVAISSGEFRAVRGSIIASLGAWFGGRSVQASVGSVVRLGSRVSIQAPYGPQVGAEVMPDLVGNDAPLGGTIVASVDPEVGDLVVLVVGLGGPEVLVPGFGDAFWIDPVAHVFAAIGTQQAGVPVAASVTVPNSPGLRGTRLSWGGAACHGSQTGFQATNPTSTLVQ